MAKLGQRRESHVLVLGMRPPCFLPSRLPRLRNHEVQFPPKNQCPLTEPK